MTKYDLFQNYIYTLEDLFHEYQPEMHSDTVKSILMCSMDDTLRCFEQSVEPEDCFKGYFEEKE